MIATVSVSLITVIAADNLGYLIGRGAAKARLLKSSNGALQQARVLL